MSPWWLPWPALGLWESCIYLHLERSVLEPAVSMDCLSFCLFPEFFDIGNHKCVRAFTFIDLDSCVLVMDYW